MYFPLACKESNSDITACDNSYDEVFSDDGISSVNDSVTSCDDSDKVSN